MGVTTPPTDSPKSPRPEGLQREGRGDVGTDTHQLPLSQL